MQKWTRGETQNEESGLEPGAAADAAAGFEVVVRDDGLNGPGPNGPELVVQGGVERLLSAEQFQRLSDVPAAMVWLANINNLNTRRAYQGDLEAFCGLLWHRGCR